MTGNFPSSMTRIVLKARAGQGYLTKKWVHRYYKDGHSRQSRSCSLALDRCFFMNFRKSISCLFPPPSLLSLSDSSLFLQNDRVYFSVILVPRCWEEKGITRSLETVGGLWLLNLSLRAFQTYGMWVHGAAKFHLVIAPQTFCAWEEKALWGHQAQRVPWSHTHQKGVQCSMKRKRRLCSIR